MLFHMGFKNYFSLVQAASSYKLFLSVIYEFPKMNLPEKQFFYHFFHITGGVIVEYKYRWSHDIFILAANLDFPKAEKHHMANIKAILTSKCYFCSFYSTIQEIKEFTEVKKYYVVKTLLPEKNSLLAGKPFESRMTS